MPRDFKVRIAEGAFQYRASTSIDVGPGGRLRFTTSQSYGDGNDATCAAQLDRNAFARFGLDELVESLATPPKPRRNYLADYYPADFPRSAAVYLRAYGQTLDRHSLNTLGDLDEEIARRVGSMIGERPWPSPPATFEDAVRRCVEYPAGLEVEYSVGQGSDRVRPIRVGTSKHSRREIECVNRVLREQRFTKGACTLRTTLYVPAREAPARGGWKAVGLIRLRGKRSLRDISVQRRLFAEVLNHGDDVLLVAPTNRRAIVGLFNLENRAMLKVEMKSERGREIVYRVDDALFEPPR